MQNFRVVLTGVSRGIGNSLLHLILKTNPSWQVIATARTDISEIQQKIQLDYPKSNVKIEALDLSDKQSIKQFVRTLKEKNFEIDCLINNAAFGADAIKLTAPPLETATNTFISNVIGTIELTDSLIPLLKDNGRIVQVSSGLSALKLHGQQVIDIFTNPNITREQIFEQVKIYENGCLKGNVGSFSTSAYATSKMMLNAYSRFVLRKELKPNQLSVAMSPGHCKTDMADRTFPGAVRTSLDGAKAIYACIQGKRDYDHFYAIETASDYINCNMK